MLVKRKLDEMLKIRKNTANSIMLFLLKYSRWALQYSVFLEDVFLCHFKLFFIETNQTTEGGLQNIFFFIGALL